MNREVIKTSQEVMSLVEASPANPSIYRFTKGFQRKDYGAGDLEWTATSNGMSHLEEVKLPLAPWLVSILALDF